MISLRTAEIFGPRGCVPLGSAVIVVCLVLILTLTRVVPVGCCSWLCLEYPDSIPRILSAVLVYHCHDVIDIKGLLSRGRERSIPGARSWSSGPRAVG